MPSFDLIAGSDSGTVDRLISQVYGAVYPNIFKGTLQVGTLKIDSVDFDISSAPTLQLSAPLETESDLRKALKNNKYGETSKLDAKIIDEIIALTEGTILTASLPAVGLVIHYSGGGDTPVAGSVSVAINILTQTTNGQNSFTVSIVKATITIPGNPVLQALLQDAFVPLLIGYLNEHVLNTITVPALQLGSVTISLPLPAVQPPYVFAVSALGATQPDVPAPYAWPTGAVFIGADANLLQAVAGIPFPLQKGPSFSWGPVDGSLTASIAAPTDVTVNGDGSLSAQITLSIGGNLTLHTPNSFPNISFSPSASATVGTTLLASIDNGALYIKIEGLSVPNFSFDFGIPGWINWFFDPIEDALSAALNAILSPVLSGLIGLLPAIEVFTLPVVNLSIGGSSFQLQLENGQISNVDGLLMVAVTPEVTKSSGRAAIGAHAHAEAVPA